MELFGKTLDPETQLLVAIGAAVSAGCQPCLTRLVGMAQTAEIGAQKLQTAAIIGQFVKDQPATDMKKLADELLGTHLAAQGATPPCPLDNGTAAGSARHHGNQPGEDAGCGCGCN